MKKFILPLAAALGIILTSCGDGSEKGNWSEEDREKFDEVMEENAGSFEAMGDLKDEFIECYYDKLEANYENFEEADGDLEGAKKYAQECTEELLYGKGNGESESTKGNWSKEDIDRFNADMESVDGQLDAMGDMKEAFIECYFDKLQNTFGSYTEANSDVEAASAFAQECTEEVMQ